MAGIAAATPSPCGFLIALPHRRFYIQRMVKLHWPRLHRKIHYWGAIICALPVLVVIISGILLLLKKQSAWIQPPTSKGSAGAPLVAFDAIYQAAAAVPQAGVRSWDDIERLDVRPDKGVIKVVTKNSWEIQVDHRSGEVLQTAYRRSDLIEAIHDGSFFHENVKTWVFLPSALVLLVLWITGIYLFVKPLLVRRGRRASVRNSP
jgi:uncharacterized iron-regulated membrane protein